MNSTLQEKIYDWTIKFTTGHLNGRSKGKLVTMCPENRVLIPRTFERWGVIKIRSMVIKKRAESDIGSHDPMKKLQGRRSHIELETSTKGKRGERKCTLIG